MYFYLKEPKKLGESLVYLIYPLKGKKPFKFSTGQKINPKEWDFKNNMPLSLKGRNDIAAIRKVLNNYNDFLEDTINECKKKEIILSSEFLKVEFNKKFKGKSIKTTGYFSDYIEDFINNKAPDIINRRTGKKLSVGIIKTYRTTLLHYKGFEKETYKRSFNELNVELHTSLVEWLSTVKNLSANTIGCHIKNLKTFARHAIRENHPVNPVIVSSDFYMLKEEADSVYLSVEEIETIFNYKTKSTRKNNVRKLCIIGCWTGLRFGDWSNFGNFKDGFLRVKNSKTGNRVVIPLHPMVAKILEEGLPYMITDVEFNRIIKEVVEEAGITNKVFGSRRNPETNRKETGLIEKYKLISSHTCRRSFATNNYLKGVDSYTIMQITGHKTESSFLKYIKVSPKQHAERLLKSWV